MNSQNKFASYFGGIGRALSNRNYRLYWSGQVVMVQGFWIYKIASGWLIWEMTESAAWLGALGSAYMLPVLFFGPIGGAVADRFGYRRCAIVMSAAGAIAAFITAVLTFAGLINPTLLVCLALIQGLLFAFEFPARQSLFPILVERKDMSAAVAVNATTFYSSNFTGPLIGGLLLTLGEAGTGPSLGFAANALCMAWMVSVLIRIPTPPNLHKRLAAKKASGIFNDLLEGLRYTRNHIDIRLLVLLSFAASLFIRHYLDFLAGFSGDVFDRGKEGLATLTAISGIGSMIFAGYFAVRGRAKGLVTYLFIGQIGAGFALVWFSLSTDFIVALLALSLVGGLLVSASIAVQSLIQHCVDDAFRARVISINISIAVGAPALSALAVGWIAEFYGLQISLAGSAILAVLITLPLGLLLLKRRHAIEGEK